MSWLLKLIPTSTIAAWIAEMVTKALANIKDKDKLAKISEAVGAASTAVNVTAEACKDGEITEGEVDAVSTAVQTAVEAIVKAAK